MGVAALVSAEHHDAVEKHHIVPSMTSLSVICNSRPTSFGAMNIFRDAKPDLETMRYMGTYARRPENFRELGIVKGRQADGTETCKVASVRDISPTAVLKANEHISADAIALAAQQSATEYDVSQRK